MTNQYKYDIHYSVTVKWLMPITKDYGQFLFFDNTYWSLLSFPSLDVIMESTIYELIITLIKGYLTRSDILATSYHILLITLKIKIHSQKNSVSIPGMLASDEVFYF